MNYNKKKYKDVPPGDKRSKVVSIKGKALIDIASAYWPSSQKRTT
jgi:hypothetical protein